MSGRVALAGDDARRWEMLSTNAAGRYRPVAEREETEH